MVGDSSEIICKICVYLHFSGRYIQHIAFFKFSVTFPPHPQRKVKNHPTRLRISWHQGVFLSLSLVVPAAWTQQTIITNVCLFKLVNRLIFNMSSIIFKLFYSKHYLPVSLHFHQEKEA